VKSSTPATTVENTVAPKTGAGTANTELRIAPSEQQAAQTLHFCWLP
jgi:hypothetical protein